MGIQTNAVFNDEYYDRQVSDEKIVQTVRMIHNYSNQVHPFYDFINFNPKSIMAACCRLSTSLTSSHCVRFCHPPSYAWRGNCYYIQRLVVEKKIPGEEVKKTSRSDYHNLSFEDYKHWPTFYLNLLLEWIPGSTMRNGWEGSREKLAS